MPRFLDNLQFKLFQMVSKAQTDARTGGAIPYNLSKTAVWTDWTNENAVKEGYKAAVFVYSCINKKAKAVASVPWYVYKQNAQGDWEKEVNHPLEMLIDRPNPFMSRSDLMERLVMNLDLTGNSLFKKVMVNNMTVELFPIGPDGIKPVPHDTEFISGYTYKVGNEIFDFKTDEIMHALYIDPSNVYWGLSPLQVAAKTVDTDVEAVTWNKIALQNRAVTDGVFTFDQSITREQWLDARNQVREQHQGSRNARAPWVLGGGATWQSMSLSPADMDFIEGRKMTREEICTVFDVPPPIVGILDKANYSNMKEARRVFWLDTIIPLLESIKNILNRSLNPEYGNGVEIDFDLSNVEALQENFNEKIDGAYKLWSMGIPFNTINQRLELGFDEMPGGEVGFLPASMMPASIAASTVAPQDPPQQPNTTLPPPEEEEDNNDPEDPPPPKGKRTKTLDKQIQEQHQKRYMKAGLNLQTQEQKVQYWKAMERSRAQWYANLQNQAADIFTAEGERVVKAFEAAETPRAGLKAALDAINPEPWEQLLKRNYEAIANQYANEITSGFKSLAAYRKKAAEDVDEEVIADEIPDFDPWDANIQTYLQTMAAFKVKYITDTTMREMRALITLSRDSGGTMDDIARQIMYKFQQYSEYRAFRIARTEVVAASNFGSYFGALQASDRIGREMNKEWVDSGDDRVREKHEKMNGETVPVDQKYSNGLDYPGDMLNGSASQVIHCRCAQVYTVL